MFRAHDKELGRDIAVKELLERGNVSEIRFLREALITARLEHPGIVPVHEAGRWPDGTPFYAMKLVSGNSLKTLIEKATTLDERLALIPNVIAVAEAIAYAHDRKIIHRDLKPANVIVGDFGETVVIDWGLAKSLDEPVTTVDSPYRGAQASELTLSGSVLGTPAYMAPEQQLGLADERTDIYAIGGILFHLLVGHAPNPSHRDGLQISIDIPDSTPRDLKAILEKVLSPSASSRYQTARALADDLRRYTLRQAVLARHYSRFEKALRFLGQHRAATLSAVIGLCIATTILTLSLVKLDAEKDKVESAHNLLLLQHAESLLRKDPTAALRLLSEYSGIDTDRRDIVAAEAIGRGVAMETSSTHSDSLVFLDALKDGSLVSLGEDQRLIVTKQSTTGTTRDVLSREASSPISVSSNHQFIAYQNSRVNITLLEPLTRRSEQIVSPHSRMLAVSSNGHILAVATADGLISIRNGLDSWRIQRSLSAPRLSGLEFTSQGHLLVFEGDRIRSISENRPDVDISIDVSTYAVLDDKVIAGTSEGRIAVLNSELLEPLWDTSACNGPVSAVTLVPYRDLMAYLCPGGTIHVVRLSSKALVDEFVTTPTATTLISSANGALLLSLTNTSTALVYTVDTRLTHRLDGHSSKLTAIAAPVSGYQYITTGDTNGEVRSWPLPTRDEWLIARVVDSGIYTAAFSPDGKLIAVDGDRGIIRTVRLDTGAINAFRGHTADAFGVVFSPSGQTLVSCSLDGTARTWRVSDGAPLRTFTSHGAHINGALFDGDHHVVTVGEDGRMFRWSTEGDDYTLLATHDSPLAWLKRFNRTQKLIVVDASMKIWEATANGLSLLYTHNEEMTFFKLAPKQDYAIIGDALGNVIVIDTSNWQIAKTYHMRGAIRIVGIDHASSQITIAAKNSTLSRVQLRDDSRPSWDSIPIAARDVQYSRDGNHLAVVTQSDGIWLYSVEHATWWFWQPHDSETRSGQFTSDGRLFVTFDASGQIIAHVVDHNNKYHSGESDEERKETVETYH